MKKTLLTGILIAIPIVVIGLTIFLAITNPSKTDYAKWVKEKIVADSSDPINGEYQHNPTSEPSIPDDDALDRFVPGGGWIAEEKKLLSFSRDLIYLVVGISRKDYLGPDTTTGHILILRWMGQNTENPWLSVWQSPSVGSSLLDGSHAIHRIESVQSAEAALVVTEFNLGGTRGISHIMAFVLGLDGNVRLHKNVTTGLTNVETVNGAILVLGEGARYEFGLDKGQFTARKIARGELTEPGAIEAPFLLGSEGVVAAGNPVMVMSVGDTVAFVPLDEATAEAFDTGKIEIYTDAWNGPPLDLSQANRLKIGNSYTFTRTGLVRFHLSSEYSFRERMAGLEPSPTFTITVTPPEVFRN